MATTSLKYDLSILIPARSEQFISNTVADILKNKRGKTEVLVGLDGEWADPPIEDHQDVRIVYLGESIGQRAMQNKLATLSRAKYVMKVDAHCAFDGGFDVKMLEAFKETGDDVTMVPMMLNLWAYDWKCLKCGSRWYQGPKPTQCMKRGRGTSDMSPNPDCDGQKFTQRTVFKPRPDTPHATSYRFDNMLHFQYFNEYKDRQKGDLVESMSLQGSCFMTTRERYWRLELCDESWGSWGQQGSEVAIKTWLSGDRVICNKQTWYAHLFRTQTGFSFPYPQSGKSQQRARDICNDIFKNNKWPQQKLPLSWLVEKFWPVPGWTQEDLDKIKPVPLKTKPGKGILYFTDNELPLKIAKNVQGRLRKITQEKGMELVSSTRKPMGNMGVNVVTKLPRGYECYFKQILAGLEAMASDIVFMAEHDVLYPPEHFDFTPKEHKIYYDVNWWKIHSDGLAVSWEADQVSGLCAYREDLLKYYRERVETFNPETFDRKFEPDSGTGSEQWKASVPYIDIRTGRNLTYNKRKIEHFRKKETAVNFQSTTIDKIPNWELRPEDIY